MLKMDMPAISVAEKSNEENMSVTKAYLINLVENLSYEISNLEARVERLEGQNADDSRSS